MISVLYIDDEPDLLNLAKLFLEKDGGFVVTTAASAGKALSLLSENQFDAVISDYQMPGMNGIELLKEFRSRYGDRPFILFTGRGREEVVIEAINNGADFYLQKGGDARAQFAELEHKVKQATRRFRAEEDVRESESRYRTLFEFTEAATIIIEEDMMISLVNEAFIRLWGGSRDEIEGRMKWTSFVSPEDLDRMFRYHKERRKSGGEKPPSAYELHFVNKAGNHRRIRIQVGMIPGTRRSVASLIDITGIQEMQEALRAAYEQLSAQEEELRRQYKALAQSDRDLQEREAAYRAIFEQSPSAIIITRMTGKYVEVNDRFCEMTGVPRSALIGKRPEEIWLSADVGIDKTKQIFDQSGGQVDRHEITLSRMDGTPFHFLMSARVIRYHGEQHVLAILHEVTDWRNGRD